MSSTCTSRSTDGFQSRGCVHAGYGDADGVNAFEDTLIDLAVLGDDNDSISDFGIQDVHLHHACRVGVRCACVSVWNCLHRCMSRHVWTCVLTVDYKKC